MENRARDIRRYCPVRIVPLLGLAVGATLYVTPSVFAVTSAELHTTRAYGYGRFEARVQFPAGDGVVGSFFLWKSGSEVSGTYWNELYFEKIRADCALQINANYGLPVASHDSLLDRVSGLCTGYHTYAYEWTPEYLAWFVDGREVRRDTGPAAQAYARNAVEGMRVHFNIWPGTPSFGGNFAASVLPVHQYVSWVQYARHTPGAVDGGGDFSLEWRESFEDGLPAGWAKGTWVSPLQQSTHSPLNVTVVKGVAVFSLTPDGSLGFSGSPPQDSGELPTVPLAAGGAASHGYR